MKTWEWLKWASIIVGTLGVLSIAGAWWLQGTGEPQLWGMTQGHLFTDATVLLLAAIWFKLGAFWHKWAGK